MPSTYYLNSVDLATATYIYTDASMTAAALQGYYSDGTICRYWHYDAVINDFVLDPYTFCE
jgi:hypothetical protein